MSQLFRALALEAKEKRCIGLIHSQSQIELS